MKSYLLALDGSKESLLAAEMAWKLAEANQAKLVAQTVVDSQCLWQLIGRDLPGIIGNGPYLAAHESIHAALKTVSETLLTAYQARAQGHDIESECILDEGNTLSEIVKRAKDHLLVIMGHRRGREDRPDQDRSSLPHYSLAEHLVYQCPRPLLIVQDEGTLWKTARLITSQETYDKTKMNNFLELAKSLKLKLEVYCIAPEHLIDKFVRSVRNSIPEGEQIRVLFSDNEDGDPAWECATDVPASTLLVVSTENTKEGRKTCAGTNLDSFVHLLHLPAVLILPDKMAEEAHLQKAENKSLAKNR